MTPDVAAVMASAGTHVPAVSADTYAQILQFYARHMQLLDAGSAEEWAEGFTEDGVFAQNVKPEPWKGRSHIATSMRRGVDRLAGRNVQRRHWFSMVVAVPESAGAGRRRRSAPSTTRWSSRPRTAARPRCI